MNEIVRLIAFGIVIFAVTVFALLLSVPDFAQAIGRGLGLVPPEGEGAVPRVAESDTVVRQYRPNLGTWVGLEGFPSQTSVAFPIPSTAKVVGGQLQLDLETDLIEQGDGLVKILINERERDAIVLEPGNVALRLTYDLFPSDLAMGRVTVTLNGDGTTNGGQICPTHVTNLGAAVEILPTTGVLLELAEPLADIDARVVLTPDPVPLDGTTETALAAWASQFLTRQGVTAEPAPPQMSQTMLLTPDQATSLALTESGQILVGGATGVEEVGKLKAAALPASYAYDWPLPIAALTSDLDTHTFRGSTHWTLNYKLADLPGGQAPGRLHLALRVSQLAEGVDWTMRVQLNGDLIHSADYDGATETIVADMDLPVESQTLANVLSISLVNNAPNPEICSAGPEAAAQLLPETEIFPASSSVTDEQKLVAALSSADSIGLSAETAKGITATVGAEGLLDLILPLDVPVVFDGSGSATVRIIEADTVATGSAAGTYYLFPGTNADDDLAIWAAGTATRPPPQSIGLAVSW